MTKYISVRASEILHQGELVAFLKSRFPESTKPLGRSLAAGAETVETVVPANSPAFEEIRNFILARRKEGLHGFSDFTIGRYL
jgi:hypothetical protein